MCDLMKEAYHKENVYLKLVVLDRGRAVNVEGHRNNMCGPEKAKCFCGQQ